MQTIRGDGILICGEVQTAVFYNLSVTRDELGKKQISGHLQNIDSAVAIIAAKSACRLLLKWGKGFDAHIMHADDRGNAQIKSSGPIPDHLMAS